jgi:DNA-binding MarR family transcriptional regulator
MNDLNRFYELEELFIRMCHHYSQIESKPVKVKDQIFYKTEIDVINVIGAFSGSNMTELSNQLGVTKGALSQMVKKMVKKNLVVKTHKGDNEKEVFLELTDFGNQIFKLRAKIREFNCSLILNEFNNLKAEQAEFIKYIFSSIMKQMAPYLQKEYLIDIKSLQDILNKEV